MVLLFVLCLLFWIVLNGKITLEILLLGLPIVFFTCLLVKKTSGTKISPKGKGVKKAFYALNYFFLLVWEVIKSNIEMIRIVLTVDNKDLKPTLYPFTTDLKTRGARVTLANSITLTPGTITVLLIGQDYLIHALDASMLDGIDESVFVQNLRKMEEI